MATQNSLSAKQIAAQLYTVREFTKTEADIAETMKKVRQLGYEAVQCSALGPIEPEALKNIVDGEGISIIATHTSYNRMRDEPQAVIDEHQLWDVSMPRLVDFPANTVAQKDTPHLPKRHPRSEHDSLKAV